MNTHSITEPRHPIRVVARRTGLPPATLRAWEKRYGVVEPHRSEGGQRLYTDEDVVRLRLLRSAVAGGRSIGQVADLSTAELEALVREDGQAGAITSLGFGTGEELQELILAEALDAVARFDVAGLEQILRRGAMRLQATDLLDRVVVGLLVEVGERWHRGELEAAKEHAASVALQRFLGWILTSTEGAEEGPTLVATTPSGQRHEFGALLAAAAAALEGWNSLYLGPDLPANEIVASAMAKGASVVALSALVPERPANPVEEALELRHLLPDDVSVIVGGRGFGPGADQLAEAGIVVVEDLAAFRQALRTNRSKRFWRAP